MARKKGFFANKRAVTPVLSDLLLTVVAVAAMAIATTATYVITTNLREIMSERVVIEDVWFNSAAGSIHIYLRNIGKVAVEVSGLYINHTSRAFNQPFRLERGEHKWLNVSGYVWTSGSLYYIDVVTKRGTHIAGYYKAP